MIGQTFGRYRITASLGRGGMATVWRAEDPLLGRDVALKVISDDLARSPGARARFRIEAENGRRLDHPGIVPVVDYSPADAEKLWIAFGLVDGETLSDRIARAPMDPREAARIVADAAEAVAHAHERGVLHRDISTKNIMIGKDGRVFVLDFGLSRALDAETMTSTGAILGTPHFLSPEVARGDRAVPATDVWGLGVVLYEALTGRLPFRRDRNEALLHAILNEEVVPPSRVRHGLDRAWDVVLANALQRDPTIRVPAAASFAAMVRECTDRSSAFAGSDGPEQAFRLDSQVDTQGWPPKAPPEPREVSRIFLAIVPFAVAAHGLGPEGIADFGLTLAKSLAAGLSSDDDMRIVDPDMNGASAAEDLAGLARRVGANRILTGDVRRVGGDVRISWRLIDPHAGATLAADVVDGTIGDLFTLEDRVLAGVQRLLQRTARKTRRTGRDPAARDRFQQALGYLERNDHLPSIEAAIGLLERLVESEGGSADILGALGRAYLLKRRLVHERIWEQRAASACERALEIDPASRELRLTLAELDLEMGRPDSALARFRALCEEKAEARCLQGLGRAFEARGLWSEAQEAFQMGIAMAPNLASLRRNLGMLYFRTARHAEAVDAFLRSLELDPWNARTLSNLGAAYFQMGRIEDAIEACRRSIATEPSARALSNLGTALFALARYPEAVDAFERATAFLPNDAETWGNLGSAYRLIPGRDPECRKALGTAVALMKGRLERQPHNAEWWCLLACWLVNLGDFESAHEALERALALAPDDVSILARGVGVEQERRPDLAISLLRRALDRGYRLETFLRDPALARLRERPEFIAFLEDHRTGGAS